MFAQVRVTGRPVVGVDAHARIEVMLPISAADAPWRRAFDDALPTRKHTGRIRADRDRIRIAVDDEEQLADFFYVVMDAVEHANRRVERLEAAGSPFMSTAASRPRGIEHGDCRVVTTSRMSTEHAPVAAICTSCGRRSLVQDYAVIVRDNVGSMSAPLGTPRCTNRLCEKADLVGWSFGDAPRPQRG